VVSDPVTPPARIRGCVVSRGPVLEQQGVLPQAIELYWLVVDASVPMRRSRPTAGWTCSALNHVPTRRQCSPSRLRLRAH